MTYKLRPDWTIDLKQEGPGQSTIILSIKKRIVAVIHIAHHADQDPISLIVSNFSAAFEIID